MDKIIERATLKRALLSTLLFAFFYVLINFSAIGVAGLLEITNGANILDLEFGFTYEKASTMLSALGDTGREFYLTRIIPLDVPFPLSYMLCYAGWISLLVKRTRPEGKRRLCLILPVLAMMFDWIENTGIIVMLKTYPALPEWAVLLASFSGMLKFVFTILSIVSIALLLICAVVTGWRKRYTTENKKETL